MFLANRTLQSAEPETAPLVQLNCQGLALELFGVPFDRAGRLTTLPFTLTHVSPISRTRLVLPFVLHWHAVTHQSNMVHLGWRPQWTPAAQERLITFAAQ